MKCLGRQLLKGMVLGGILFIGVTLQSAKVEAAGLRDASTQVVAEAGAIQNEVVTPNQQAEVAPPIWYSPKFQWETKYHGLTVRYNVDLKTLLRSGVCEIDICNMICNIDICKLICNCDELQKWQKMFCDYVIYASGRIDVTVLCGDDVLFTCGKNINYGVR
ncbi:hypothetical protein SAMN05421493_10754 [Pseudobutyrivibrio sp. 49]|uniref:hypothetical protein n=1 Tax=Pseudobutyrivibrio sp. 49 TaxID=1855344 RepID=UPI000883B34B|nr:hypothetical protein [Pseudobutyrivibrio sp. 49]SDI05030.1 hypothetical protein SAMN05421493_10754 [Pseudobutyrivibrio sp. 49]